MNELLKRLSKNAKLYQWLRDLYYGIIVKPSCDMILLFYNFKLWLIEKGIIREDFRYKKIKELKNKHRGQRCFIVATGPSVKMSDLEAIKDEVSISMNSIVNVLEDTKYRPTYYMIQDYTPFTKLYQNIQKLPTTTIKLVGVNNTKRPDYRYAKKLIKNDKSLYLYRENFAAIKRYGNRPIDQINVGFSWDCSREIIDGYTVTYSAIQLAVYMGVREIYLIGCDCNYSQTVNHIGEYVGANHEYSGKTEARLMRSYACARKYLREKVNIFNATRGGQLEVFPRKNFDDIVSNNKK